MTCRPGCIHLALAAAGIEHTCHVPVSNEVSIRNEIANRVRLSTDLEATVGLEPTHRGFADRTHAQGQTHIVLTRVLDQPG